MDEKFPIGKFHLNQDITEQQIDNWINDIEMLPQLLREIAVNATEEELNTPYRKGGWTVRQVFHHLADSHLNAYIRFKLAITEDKPTIKPYEQDKWANLADSNEPVAVSIKLLESLHHRMVILLRSLTMEDVQKVFIHPELGAVTISQNIALYSWHGRHHLAHISSVCTRTA